MGTFDFRETQFEACDADDIEDPTTELVNYVSHFPNALHCVKDLSDSILY